MVGVVNGISDTTGGAATGVIGVLALIIGFGLWWNHVDVVGHPLCLRGPRRVTRP